MAGIRRWLSSIDYAALAMRLVDGVLFATCLIIFGLLSWGRSAVRTFAKVAVVLSCIGFVLAVAAGASISPGWWIGGVCLVIGAGVVTMFYDPIVDLFDPRGLWRAEGLLWAIFKVIAASVVIALISAGVWGGIDSLQAARESPEPSRHLWTIVGGVLLVCVVLGGLSGGRGRRADGYDGMSETGRELYDRRLRDGPMGRDG